MLFILLNGASDSLILFKFWNISRFLLSSFTEISNGHCLSSVVFPSLIARSIMPWSKVIFIMLLQSPMNFLMSSSFLSSGSGFFDSGSLNTIMFLLLFSCYFSSLSLSFSDFSITSSTVLFSGVSMISVHVLPATLLNCAVFI